MRWALTTFFGAILVALGTYVTGVLTGWLGQPTVAPPTKEEIELVELCRRDTYCRQHKKVRDLLEQGYSARDIALKQRAERVKNAKNP